MVFIPGYGRELEPGRGRLLLFFGRRFRGGLGLFFRYVVRLRGGRLFA